MRKGTWEMRLCVKCAVSSFSFRSSVVLEIVRHRYRELHDASLNQTYIKEEQLLFVIHIWIGRLVNYMHEMISNAEGQQIAVIQNLLGMKSLLLVHCWDMPLHPWCTAPSSDLWSLLNGVSLKSFNHESKLHGWICDSGWCRGTRCLSYVPKGFRIAGQVLVILSVFTIANFE